MTQQRHPLRSIDALEEGSSTNPEALLISSYLTGGMFTNEADHVKDSDIVCWTRLWLWATDYQRHAGKAPAPNVVKIHFPEFEVTPGVSTQWAAAQVRKESAIRSLRNQVFGCLSALETGDLDGAYTAMDRSKRPTSKELRPINAFDHAIIPNTFDSSKIPVPFPTLRRATGGGIGPSEFWVIAARPGEGKTRTMLKYAACAVSAGYKVCYHSLEMPYSQIGFIAHQLMTDDKALLRDLNCNDMAARKSAIDAIAELMPGSLDILDPSMGRINTSAAVAESCAKDYDLVMVDHCGLMVSTDGHRAVEDWRVMATISNIFRETALTTGTPLFVSSQIKRAGETQGWQPPKTSDLAQSDALGQDAEVVITMKRLCALTMAHSGQKIRNGPSVSWFSEFNPEDNRFDEISSDTAQQLQLKCKDLAFT